MKWLSLLAIAVIACLFCANDARAGGFFNQQRVIVQNGHDCGIGSQVFVQRRFQRQNVFVPSFRSRQQVLVVPQRFGFQRQNVFLQQPAVQFRFNFDD